MAGHQYPLQRRGVGKSCRPQGRIHGRPRIVSPGGASSPGSITTVHGALRTTYEELLSLPNEPFLFREQPHTIHGNVLFRKTAEPPPVVIDFSPAFRSRSGASAAIIAHAFGDFGVIRGEDWPELVSNTVFIRPQGGSF